MTRSNTIKTAAWITAVLAVGALVLPAEAASRQPVKKQQAQVSAQVDQQSFGRNPKARSEKQRDNQRAGNNRNPQRDNSKARAEQQRKQQEAKQRQESERKAQAQREAQQRQRAEREAQQRRKEQREAQQRKAAQRDAQQRKAAEREAEQRKAAQREAQQRQRAEREAQQRKTEQRQAQQQRETRQRAAQEAAAQQAAQQRAAEKRAMQKAAAKQTLTVRGANWGVNAQKKKLAERQAIVRKQEQRLEQKRIEQRQDLREAKQRFANNVQATKQVLRQRDARLDDKARALRWAANHDRTRYRAPYVHYRAPRPKVYYTPRPYYGYRPSSCVYKRDYDYCDWGDIFSVRVILGTDCGYHYEHGHRRHDCCTGGYYIWKWCEPVLETRYDYYGEPYTVVIADGYWKRVWTPHYCRYGIHFYYAD